MAPPRHSEDEVRSSMTPQERITPDNLPETRSRDWKVKLRPANPRLRVRTRKLAHDLLQVKII